MCREVKAWTETQSGDIFVFIVMAMGVWPVCVSGYHLRVWCLQKSEEGMRPPRTGITDVCDLTCGCVGVKN